MCTGASLAIVGSTALSAFSSERASRAGRRAATSAIGEQREARLQMREDLTPWRDFGQNAIATLSSMLGLPEIESAADRDARLEAEAGAAPTQQSNQIAPLAPSDQAPISPLAPTNAIAQRNASGARFRPGGPSGPFPDPNATGPKAGEVVAGGTPGFDAGGDVLEGEYIPAQRGGNAIAATSRGERPVWMTPGYDFRVDETMRTLSNRRAGRDRLGGAAIREAQRYASNLASDEYGNYINRLFRAAGFGSDATARQTAATSASANAIADQYMNQANARAGGIAGFNDAIQGGIQNYLFYDYLRGLRAPA